MSIFSEFLAHPRWTGAIAASSRALAEAMTDGLALGRARTVVELGPGTGAITGAIVHRLAPGGRLIAVEVNRRLAEELSDRYRTRRVQVVHASAADLEDLVAEPVDAVVSGLPWTVMPHPVRDRVLDAVTRVLAPTGRFTTFAYVHAAWAPPARRFARDLTGCFRLVRRSSWVWGNIPPAFVYRAALPDPARRGPHRRTPSVVPFRPSDRGVGPATAPHVTGSCSDRSGR